MTYEGLARTWLPAPFDDVVGPSHVTRTLRSAIESNRVARFLFSGFSVSKRTNTEPICLRS